MLEFIEHDKSWCKPDQIDRDVRHGQLLTTTMMYVCMCGGAETVLWTADYRGDSQAKADEVVRPCAKNGPGETVEGHVLGDAGR